MSEARRGRLGRPGAPADGSTRDPPLRPCCLSAEGARTSAGTCRRAPRAARRRRAAALLLGPDGDACARAPADDRRADLDRPRVRGTAGVLRPGLDRARQRQGVKFTGPTRRAFGFEATADAEIRPAWSRSWRATRRERLIRIGMPVRRVRTGTPGTSRWCG